MTERLKRRARSGESSAPSDIPLHEPAHTATASGAAQPRRRPATMYTGTRDLLHALDAIVRHPQSMASEPAILALANPTFDPSSPSSRDWVAICTLIRGAAPPFNQNSWYDLRLYLGVWHQIPTVPILFWSNSTSFLAAADNLAQLSGSMYTATQIARETHALRAQLFEQGRFVGHLSLKFGANLDPSIHIDDLPVRHEYRDNLAYSDTRSFVFFPLLDQSTPTIPEPLVVSQPQSTSMPAAPPRAGQVGVETLPLPIAVHRDSGWPAHETIPNEAAVLANFNQSMFGHRAYLPPAPPRPSRNHSQPGNLNPTQPLSQGVTSAAHPTAPRYGKAKEHRRSASAANYHPYAHPEPNARGGGGHPSRSANRISAPPGTLTLPRPHNEQPGNGTAHRDAPIPNMARQRLEGGARHKRAESSGLVDRLATLNIPSGQSPTVTSFTSRGSTTGQLDTPLQRPARVDSPALGPGSNKTTHTSSPASAEGLPSNSTAGASGSRFAPRGFTSNTSTTHSSVSAHQPSERAGPPEMLGNRRCSFSPIPHEDDPCQVDQTIQSSKREASGETGANNPNIPPRQNENSRSKQPEAKKGWGRLQR